MWSKKTFAIAGSCAVYFILLVMFFRLQEDPDYRSACGHSEESCLRFCCFDRSTCNQKFIRENFNRSLLEVSFEMNADDKYEQVLQQYYEILYGQPDCQLEKVDKDVEWVLSKESVMINDEKNINVQKYCLQDVEITEGGEVGWMMFVCKSRENVQKIIRLYSISLSIVLLAIPILVYASYKELQTVFGKSSMFIVLGLLFNCASLLLEEHTYNQFFTAFIGFSLTLCWMGVLCFEVWWTIRNGRDSDAVGSKRFKFYCAFALGLPALMAVPIILVMFQRIIFDNSQLAHMIQLFLMVCAVAPVIGFCLLILAALVLFQSSKVRNPAEASWVEATKDKFWNCAQVYGIVLITCLLELQSYTLHEKFDAIILHDILKLFSSVLIFSIFFLKQNVRQLLFGRYVVLENVPGDEDLERLEAE